MAKFQPMSASGVDDLEELTNFPYYVSAKLDGVRCIKKDGVLLARSLKPIANANVQKKFAHLPDGVDGELIHEFWTGEDIFSMTQSIVSSHDKPADQINFIIFDKWNDVNQPYCQRLIDIQDVCNDTNALNRDTHLVPFRYVTDTGSLEDAENFYVQHGFEGMMIRQADSKYKFGRATRKQEWLMKYKRWEDTEAQIIGFAEKMSNQNEAKTNETGHTERSSAKAGLVPAGTLGSLICRLDSGVEFGIGTGFDDKLRKSIWDEREGYVGKFVKFKYQELSKDGVPRFPVFLAFREEWDMAN